MQRLHCVACNICTVLLLFSAAASLPPVCFMVGFGEQHHHLQLFASLGHWLFLQYVATQLVIMCCHSLLHI